MKRTNWLFAAIFIASLTGVLLADGMVVPYHKIRPPRPALVSDAFTVEYHVVTCDIKGQHAQTNIDQKIKNVSGRLAQAQYMFPIPRNANIAQFSMFIGEKEYQGEMLEAGEARRIYENYVRKVIDPALLEYVGTGLYKSSVFPFQKDEAKRIRLKYRELLTQESGLIRYLYPLNTEKFSKYPLKRVRVEVNIQTDKPIVTLYSPTHPVQINRIDAKRVQVIYEATQVKPYEDFELFYAVEEGKFSANVLSYQPADAPAGYFCAMIAPNTNVEAKQTPKDIVLVTDISGSMQDDRKIFQAKDAMTYIVKNLNKGDRFNVIAFSDFINAFKEELVDFTEKNKTDALAFISRLRAEGGTNIDGSLTKALSMYKKTDKSRVPIIIFMTDGKPTVGERNPAKIAENIRKLNIDKKVKIFVFSIGEEINTHLCGWLASQNHGFTEYIRTGESIKERVTAFYNKIKNPVLTNTTLICEGVRIERLLPAELPDVFSGTQLVVVGRYVGSGDAKLTLRGKLLGKDYERVIKVKFSGKSNSAKDADKVWIEHLWASRRIGHLLNQIRLHGQSEEVKKEIIKLSKKYGIPTPYTSFLVRENINPASPNVMRRGLNAFGRKLKEEKDSGADAVKDANEANQLSSAARPHAAKPSGIGGKYQSAVKKGELPGASGNPTSRVITVGTKTFYLVNKQWVDSTITDKDKDEVKTKLFSDKFFELLRKVPALNKYVARGAVKVKISGKVYNITN